MATEIKIERLEERISKFMKTHGLNGLYMTQYKKMRTQLNNLKDGYTT
jgi:hypothetical protein